MLSGELPRLKARRLTGDERLHHGPNDLGVDVARFWRWYASDLVSNTSRGRLAEFIVAQALREDTGVRDEWAPVDLITRDGHKVEVKSAAYLQSWYQKRRSSISFDIRPTRAWDPATNVLSTQPERRADAYVFALLAHQEKRTIDPLDVEQWRFYVVSTFLLDARHRSQDSITLRSLESLCEAKKVATFVPSFWGLRRAVATAAVLHRARARTRG